MVLNTILYSINAFMLILILRAIEDRDNDHLLLISDCLVMKTTDLSR